MRCVGAEVCTLNVREFFFDLSSYNSKEAVGLKQRIGRLLPVYHEIVSLRGKI